jgi:hypothetical protein
MSWKSDGGVHIDDTELVLPGPVHDPIGVIHLRQLSSQRIFTSIEELPSGAHQTRLLEIGVNGRAVLPFVPEVTAEQLQVSACL